MATTAGHAVQLGIDSLIQYFNTHAALIVLVWFFIFLGRFVKMLSGLVYAQRIRHYQTSAAPAEWQQRLNELLTKVQISRPVLLLESALIKVPVTLGFLKPVILVPVGMLSHISPDQVESILFHELAHIRRRDYLFNLVQNLVDTLFFFNPAMIWISSLIRSERENCCDDIAIRETRSRRRLIEALVSFHEYEQTAAGYALSFAAKENQVVRRVKRIVHKKNHSLNAGERVVLTTGLLILSAAFVTINGSRSAEQGKRLRANTISSPAAAKQPGVQQVVATAAGTATTATVATAPTTSAAAATTPATVPTASAVAAAVAGTANAANKPAEHAPTKATEPAPTSPIESALLNPATTSAAKPVQTQTQVPAQPAVRDTTPKTQKSSDLFQNASVDKLIEARDHGVTVEFVTRLQQMGYKNLTLDKAIELRDHGVDADFIENIREFGFTHFSLDEAVVLRDHGVSADYIGGMKKRFGRLFEINDYIKLRDAGISPTTFGQ
jgi:beta-lactamase regulating signal transducer with metallopeptidase domain